MNVNSDERERLSCACVSWAGVRTSAPWSKAYNWSCRLTLTNGALVNASARDTRAGSSSSPSSRPLPLVCSDEGATLFVIFSFRCSFLLQGMHVEIQSGRRKAKRSQRKSPTLFQDRGKQRDGPYTATTCRLHSLIIPETSCKHACWKRPAETEQLIWKRAEFSSVECDRQLHTFRACDASHPPMTRVL